jgi:hypothetical protein
MPNRKAIETLADSSGAVFTWGSQVEMDGFMGTVVEAKGSYVGVIFDDDDMEIVRFFHPNDPQLKYYRVIRGGRIKEWWVKHPQKTWEDLENLTIVCASTYMKARYKGWLIFNDAGVVSREDLLLMRTRRKYSHDDRERWREKSVNIFI